VRAGEVTSSLGGDFVHPTAVYFNKRCFNGHSLLDPVSFCHANRVAVRITSTTVLSIS
jgi:hypothetical protein